MIDELKEAWRTNNRINLLLIDAITEEGMACTLSKRGGRDVCRQFAHMHNMRLHQLEHRAKPLREGMRKFESRERPSKTELREAFDQSGARVEEFLVGVVNREPGYRGFKKGVFTALSYFVSHESHHRGSILLTLKQSGQMVDKSTSYGIWDWDRR